MKEPNNAPRKGAIRKIHNSLKLLLRTAGASERIGFMEPPE